MLDWDDLRFFIAIVRHGNLSVAAKELRVAQSTVSRRLASLEASLNVRLLHRTPDGYVATLAGDEVTAKALRLEAEALSLERDVGGRDMRLSGPVRVTCAESVANHILAPAIATFYKDHPDILVELIPDARELSLSMREADISVQLTQTTKHDLVVRRIGTLHFGLYASQGYLDEHDEIDFKAGCSGHQIIAQLDDLQDSKQTEWLTDLASRARVCVQTTGHEAAVKAAAHDGGLACLACFRADQEPGLKRIASPTSAPETGIWMVAHKDNRRNARIKATQQHITSYVRAMKEQLTPASEDWDNEPEVLQGEDALEDGGHPTA